MMPEGLPSRKSGRSRMLFSQRCGRLDWSMRGLYIPVTDPPDHMSWKQRLAQPPRFSITSGWWGPYSWIREALPLAACANLTFIYSLAGTIFSIHHGTMPIIPFHLTPAFLISKLASTTTSDLVNCAKSQFRDWVASLQKFLKKQPSIWPISLKTVFLHMCLHPGLAHIRASLSKTPSLWRISINPRIAT